MAARQPLAKIPPLEIQNETVESMEVADPKLPRDAVRNDKIQGAARGLPGFNPKLQHLLINSARDI